MWKRRRQELRESERPEAVAMTAGMSGATSEVLEARGASWAAGWCATETTEAPLHGAAWRRNWAPGEALGRWRAASLGSGADPAASLGSGAVFIVFAFL